MVQINNFTGFETQGLEESTASAGPPTFDTTDPGSGQACLLLDAAAEEYDLSLVADGITDTGSEYIVGFRVKFASLTGDETGFAELRTDTGRLWTIEVSATANKLDLEVSGDEVTSTGSVGTSNYHYVEVHCTRVGSSNDTLEFFINGVSEGTLSGITFSTDPTLMRFRYDGSNTIRVDDVYILSGATAATDRLGGGTISEMPEVFAYQNDLASATADLSAVSGGGAVLNAGNWDDAAETPGNESSSADFTGTPLDGVAYTDFGIRPGPAAVLGDTYFFDESDASCVNNASLWTGCTSGFDGSTATGVSTSSTTAGSATSGYIGAEGTDAPSSGGTINAVIARVFGSRGGTAAALNAEIATNGRAELLMDQNFEVPDTVTGWGPWFVVPAPSGGWTFATIQALEIRLYDPTTSTNVVICRRAEIFVQHSTGSTQFNPTIDGDANIRAWKGIWHAERGGGGATTHTIYIGNDADTEGNFDSTTIALLNNTEADFEFLGETDPPLSTENFAQGFGVSGNQDFRCREMWATLLHVPSAADDVDAGILIGGEQQPLIKPGGMVPY